jgi:hypothetical protein
MVRTVLKDGVFVPVDPLPADWCEGAAFRVEAEAAAAADDFPDPDKYPDAYWDRLDAECKQGDPAEFAKLHAALAEVERLSKEQARREMGLS